MVERGVLTLLDPIDHYSLQKGFSTGEISCEEYTQQVYGLAGNILLARLRRSTPGLAAPNPDDKDFNPQEYLKYIAKAKETDETYLDHLRDDVRKKAPALASKIFDDWEALRPIVGGNRDALSRRWTKKSLDKRKALLLEAWPAMPPEHRPDFDVLRRRLKGPKYRDFAMLPYINLEDLSSPRYLLQLLNSRTEMPPEHFAWSDSARFKAAVRIQAAQDDPGLTEVILLTEKRTRGSYGSLQVLTNQAEIEDILGTEYSFQLCRGLAVLETQVKLYGFLLKMTELLLHDIDLSSLISGTHVFHTYHKMEQNHSQGNGFQLQRLTHRPFTNCRSRFP